MPPPDPTLEIRVDRLEQQEGRSISDAESEKDTRARINSLHEQHFRDIESTQRDQAKDQIALAKLVYIGLGAGFVVQILVVPVLIAWLTK